MTEKPDWSGPAMDPLRERMGDHRAEWLQGRLSLLERAGVELERQIRTRRESVASYQLEMIAEIRGESVVDVVNRLLRMGQILRLSEMIEIPAAGVTTISGEDLDSEFYLTYGGSSLVSSLPHLGRPVSPRPAGPAVEPGRAGDHEQGHQ
jgi:hypothetical protein